MKLKLYNRDEIFLIDLDKVLYFKAEDHYTNIYYGRDTKLLLPFGLSHLEGLLADVCGSDNVFLRAGRSHLINMHKVVRVSVVKESVTMIGGTDSLVSLHMSKAVVRGLAKNFRMDNAVVANYLWGGENSGVVKNIKRRKSLFISFSINQRFRFTVRQTEIFLYARHEHCP